MSLLMEDKGERRAADRASRLPQANEQLPDLLHHVAEAAETLAGPHGTAKEKLVKAGSQFWAAMQYPDEWTPELLDRADRICETLLAGGTIETTAKKMDSETAATTVTELAATMARLAVDIAVARTGNQLPSQESGFRHQYE
jgi:outer membrane murein-binding lipoprotein Lpp